MSNRILTALTGGPQWPPAAPPIMGLRVNVTCSIVDVMRNWSVISKQNEHATCPFSQPGTDLRPEASG